MASREDLVVVTINYRLNTLGFLAIPGTDIKGNFGIADQLTALMWTIQNIAAFGGDPSQITIIGGSAGAGSVRALLGSPPAIGKFQGAIAQSNLGGGVDLGLPNNYATSYSSYLTIDQNYAIAGQQIFEEANCTQATLEAQIACLAQVNAVTLSELPVVANKVVQDGHYVNTEQLIVNVKNGSTAHVPVMFGTAENDGSSFSTYPRANNITSELEGIQVELGISEYYAQAIIDSGLFPYYDTGNTTLDSFNVSQRIATDNQFRCELIADDSRSGLTDISRCRRSYGLRRRSFRRIRKGILLPVAANSPRLRSKRSRWRSTYSRVPTGRPVPTVLPHSRVRPRLVLRQLTILT
jgi:carboxylesterase type B